MRQHLHDPNQPTGLSGREAEIIIASSNALVGFYRGVLLSGRGKQNALPMEDVMNAKNNATKPAGGASAKHLTVLPALERYRRVWEDAAAGQSLLEMRAPVGLILAEVADALGMNIQERRAVLGAELDRAIARFAKTRVQLRQQ